MVHVYLTCFEKIFRFLYVYEMTKKKHALKKEYWVIFPEEEEWKRSRAHKSDVYCFFFTRKSNIVWIIFSIIQKILTNEKKN